MSLCFHLTHLTIFHGSSTAQMHGTVWLSLDSRLHALKQVVVRNLFRTITENDGCNRLWVGSWWFWASAVNKSDTRKPKSSRCCHDVSWKFASCWSSRAGKKCMKSSRRWCIITYKDHKNMVKLPIILNFTTVIFAGFYRDYIFYAPLCLSVSACSDKQTEKKNQRSIKIAKFCLGDIVLTLRGLIY